ncbi:hypothetical protein Tco_0754116 [Tanacetum coccineum]
MAMLTMRTRRFLKNTEESFTVNGLQGTKKIGIGRTQKGLCQWRQLLHQMLISCEGLVIIIGSDQAEERPQLTLHSCLLFLHTPRLTRGLGYNAVPPPYTGNFMPPKPYFSFSGLEEFVNKPIVSEPKKPVIETSEAKPSVDKPKAVKKNNGAPIIEDWVSDSEEEDMPQAKIQKKIVKPSFAKIKFVKSKEQVKSPRKTANHYDCDNHQRQFNNKKMVKPVWNYTQRVNHQNSSNITHLSPKRNMVPKAVLMRSGIVSLTTARPVNTAQPRTTVKSARPMNNVFNKAHSTVRRPIKNKT